MASAFSSDNLLLAPDSPHTCYTSHPRLSLNTHHLNHTTSPQGRAVIVVEVTRPTPATTPQQLANIAKTAIACGADALCVRLDSEDTPEGLKDLFAVVQVCCTLI